MLKLVLRVGAAFFWRSVNGPVPAAGISDGREGSIPRSQNLHTHFKFQFPYPSQASTVSKSPTVAR
jgi:hypothetical protein